MELEEYKDKLRRIFEQHRLVHASAENFARAQAIQDLMEDCGLYPGPIEQIMQERYKAAEDHYLLTGEIKSKVK